MGRSRRRPAPPGSGKAPLIQTTATPRAIPGHLQRVEESEMPEKHEYDVNYTPRTELIEKAKTMCWDEVADLMAVVERMARLNMSEVQIRRCVLPVAQEAMDSLRAMLLDDR